MTGPAMSDSENTLAVVKQFLWPVAVIIASGAFVFVGTSVVSLRENSQTLASEERRSDAAIEAERQRRQTQIILNALTSSSRDERIANLEFLARTGLIDDPDQKIQAEAARLAADDSAIVPAFDNPFIANMGGFDFYDAAREEEARQFLQRRGEEARQFLEEQNATPPDQSQP